MDTSSDAPKDVSNPLDDNKSVLTKESQPSQDDKKTPSSSASDNLESSESEASSKVETKEQGSKPDKKDSAVNEEVVLIKPSKAIKELESSVKELKSFEEKAKACIEFMKTSLAQKSSPNFKDFWDAKKLVLSFFKEKMNPTSRADLWKEYVELSDQSKMLKDILDKEMSFAIDQIQGALDAIEKDLVSEESLVKMMKVDPIPKASYRLTQKKDFYTERQKKILFYLKLAQRTKELRKEILETSMRVKSKNTLLQSLSGLTDKFLPHKKKLIAEVSKEYLADAEAFFDAHFCIEKKHLKSQKKPAPLFELREEIKAFQSMAKLLSLNSKAFSKSREVLSLAWDIVRKEDKKKKDKFSQDRQEQEEFVGKLVEEIEQVEKEWGETPPKTKDAISQKIREIVQKSKEKKLVKEHFLNLKAKIASLEENALKPFALQEEKEKKRQEEKKLAREKKKEDLLSKTLAMITGFEQHTLHDMLASFDEFNKEIALLKLSDVDVLKFAQAKRDLSEKILLKRELEIESLEDASDDIQELVTSWEEFKEATRSRLEDLRQRLGNSGFDIEQAILLDEQYEIEKVRLDRAIDKIDFLEDYV